MSRVKTALVGQPLRYVPPSQAHPIQAYTGPAQPQIPPRPGLLRRAAHHAAPLAIAAKGAKTLAGAWRAGVFNPNIDPRTGKKVEGKGKSVIDQIKDMGVKEWTAQAYTRSKPGWEKLVHGKDWKPDPDKPGILRRAAGAVKKVVGLAGAAGKRFAGAAGAPNRPDAKRSASEWLAQGVREAAADTRKRKKPKRVYTPGMPVSSKPVRTNAPGSVMKPSEGNRQRYRGAGPAQRRLGRGAGNSPAGAYVDPSLKVASKGDEMPSILEYLKTAAEAPEVGENIDFSFWRSEGRGRGPETVWNPTLPPMKSWSQQREDRAVEYAGANNMTSAAVDQIRSEGAKAQALEAIHASARNS